MQKVYYRMVFNDHFYSIFVHIGMKEQQRQRDAMRLLHTLPPVLEDSVEVVKHLRAASPPASAADLIEQQTNNASRRGEYLPSCIISFEQFEKQRETALLRWKAVYFPRRVIGHHA